MPEVRRKSCSRCGAAFDCCAGGCWCDDVTLDAPTRARLREQFADCLCRACLEASAGPLVIDAVERRTPHDAAVVGVSRPRVDV